MHLVSTESELNGTKCIARLYTNLKKAMHNAMPIEADLVIVSQTPTILMLWEKGGGGRIAIFQDTHCSLNIRANRTVQIVPQLG